MSKCCGGEYDKTRQRNQFTRHERDHLLCIMSEFSEKLEDKNLSILARKEIWTTIDKKFRDGGFADRTTAQLKKYWQNYKYHNGRNKWRKENAAMGMEFFSKSSEVNDDTSIRIPPSSTESHIDAADDSQSEARIGQLCQDKQEMPMDLIKQPAVIISETDVSGSSVTVSVIHSKNGKRKKFSGTKGDQVYDETEKGMNNEVKLNPTKKLKGKCLLLQPRKSNKIEPSSLSSSSSSSSEINDNNEKYYTIGKIDQSVPTKILQSPKKIENDMQYDEQSIRNDRHYVPLIGGISNDYPGQFNIPLDYDNHSEYQGDNFQFQNHHVMRQLQLLRHLEAEEHRLKVKLAEMSLKETHLKILHLREECGSTQMKFTT